MTKTRKMPDYVWVSRNVGFEELYDIWLNPPELSGLVWCATADERETRHGPLCESMFHRLTGVKLNPGTCVKMRWRSPLLPMPKKRKVVNR